MAELQTLFDRYRGISDIEESASVPMDGSS